MYQSIHYLKSRVNSTAYFKELRLNISRLFLKILNNILMTELIVNDVATRKASNITETLCGTPFSISFRSMQEFDRNG